MNNVWNSGKMEMKGKKKVMWQRIIDNLQPGYIILTFDSMEWVRGETIGYGSFSTVTLATPTDNDSGEFPPLMAVKSSDSYARQREIGDCDEIVRCYGEDRTVENGDEMYNLFLEYASRGSLGSNLKKLNGEGLPEATVCRYTGSVLRGLRHIHANGFAHCDLKLRNILLCCDGAVKIADFGLAKRTEEVTASSGVQIRGMPLSEADVWALGCAVVEMFIGETAWSFKEGSHFMSLLIRMVSERNFRGFPRTCRDKEETFCQNPKKRWTAEMLLNHPFIAVDLDPDDLEETDIHLKTEDVSTSPRCPFEFADWVSASSDSETQYRPFDSLDERIASLATDLIPDWSVTSNWVTPLKKKESILGFHVAMGSAHSNESVED
ncbi:hypothetical protein HID58_007359 [Brassica napus]|uniref:Protein kinase domain-containing protein n=1 Tax=Brassica napus TaxID=3708 RepID=A0ABQ8EE09_BRANA|nr:hypothetical protein HID58_007359 [Brassica napus]